MFGSEIWWNGAPALLICCFLDWFHVGHSDSKKIMLRCWTIWLSKIFWTEPIYPNLFRNQTLPYRRLVQCPWVTTVHNNRRTAVRRPEWMNGSHTIFLHKNTHDLIPILIKPWGTTKKLLNTMFNQVSIDCTKLLAENLYRKLRKTVYIEEV